VRVCPCLLLLPSQQALPAELTAEAALSSDHEPLVGDMVAMLGRLKQLSHLQDAGPLQVGCPEPACCEWWLGGAHGCVHVGG